MPTPNVDTRDNGSSSFAFLSFSFFFFISWLRTHPCRETYISNPNESVARMVRLLRGVICVFLFSFLPFSLYSFFSFSFINCGGFGGIHQVGWRGSRTRTGPMPTCCGVCSPSGKAAGRQRGRQSGRRSRVCSYAAPKRNPKRGSLMVRHNRPAAHSIYLLVTYLLTYCNRQHNLFFSTPPFPLPTPSDFLPRPSMPARDEMGWYDVTLVVGNRVGNG